MNELLSDIKSAFCELIGCAKPQPTMDTIYERSRYDTYCVMALDMRQSGHTVKEIADRLEVSKRKVKAMLAQGSVPAINRTGGSSHE